MPFLILARLASPGTIEFNKGGYFVFNTNLGGVATLQLDLNGNGIFGDPEDVLLTGTLNEGADSLFWNGQDGLGNPISVQDSLSIGFEGTIRFGESHIALTDVEGITGGVTFQWMNAPAGFPTDEFYYDHSDIDPNIAVSVSGGGTPGNALPTTTPYTYPVNEGNDDYIDHWFFIEQTIPRDTLFVNVVVDCFCDPEDNPDITAAGQDVCEGDILTLTASNSNTTNGLGPIDYSWSGPNNYQFTDADIDPTGTSTVNVTNSSTIDNAGTYQVIATTSALCADTATIGINITPTPVLQASGSPDVQVCENSDVQLCANNTVAGIGQMDYTWTGPNGFMEQGQANGTDQICIDLTGAGSTLEGDYTLVASANGCTSAPLVFSVDVQPTPEINGISDSQSACVGESVTLTASNVVAGTGPIIYTWTGPNFTFTDTTANENGPFSVTVPNLQLTDAGAYTLVLSTLAGCASTAQSTSIGVNPLPEICNTTGGGDACVGQTVTLSAFNCAGGLSGTFNYQWSAPDGSVICDGTLNSDGPFTCEVANIQADASGQYCLVLVDSATNCASDQVCLDINVLPSINITGVSPDGVYCGGTDVTLSATTSFGSDVVYTWTGPGGLLLCSNQVPAGTPLSCTIMDMSGDDVGNYTLTVASLDGCMSTPVTVFVGLLDGVTITSTGGGGGYCVGDTAMLTGTSTSTSGSVTYTWIDPNGMVVGTGTTAPDGPFAAAVPNPAVGTYTLVVLSEPDMCGDTATVDIEIVDTPVGNILTGTGDTTLCELDSIVLCAQNTNPDIGDFTYTWTTPSGQTITGTGNGTAEFCEEFDPVSTYGEGAYTLEICAGNCCSDPVSINIILRPNPVISAITGGGTYCEGDTALICFSNTNPAVTDWFYTCNIDTTQTTSTGTGTNEVCLEITSTALIFCSLESIDGCVSDLVGTQVDFEPNFTPELSTDDTTLCANQSLPLNGSNPSSCTGDVTYTWTGPGGFTFTGTAPCSGPFPAEDPTPTSGEYCLDLDNGTGSNCSEQACMTVTVLELPTIANGATIGGGGEYCVGDDLMLTATIENPSGGDIDYEWTQDGMVVSTGTAASGDMITLDLTPAALDATGEYCLNLTCVDTGCSDEGLGCTQVTVNETPVIDDVTGSGTYCQDFDVMISGSGPTGPGNVTYTWTGPNFTFTGTAPCGGPYDATIDNIDLDQAGVYTLVVTKGSCESEEAQVVIEVNPTPDILNVSSGGAECLDAMTTISFTIDPDGAASVDWTVTGPGLNESGTVTTTTDFDFDITVMSGTSTYTITAISDEGCEADPMNVTITEIVVPVPPLSADVNMPCPGESVTFTTDLVQGATYAWCLNGSPIAGAPNNPTFTDNNPQEGDYTVKITIDGCTEESAPATITFPVSPIANDDNYTTDAGVPITGENILDNDDTATGVSVIVVSQPTNGSVTVGPNGEMTYTPDAGFSGTDQFIYNICSNECPDDCDEAIVTIVVEVGPCDVPNVITPDGDGVNDILVIDCVPAFPNNRLRIFNRWGDEIDVFEPYENTWDGTIGSSKDPVPAGTYFYLFQEDRSSDDHKAGYVKVVR